MDFSQFGKRSFVKESKVDEFVDFLKKGKIMGTICKNCGKIFFPPRKDCPDCFTNEFEWIDITDRKFKIITFTEVNFGPAGFEKEVPYSFATVKSEDGEIKFLAPLKNPENAKIGQEVRFSIDNKGDRVWYGLTSI